MVFLFPKSDIINFMKKLIVANWKMAPQSLEEAKKIFAVMKRAKFSTRTIDAVICPPSTYFSDLVKGYSGKSFKFGVQDVHFNNEAASTGEISTEMVSNLGADFVIVGHAERRALGDTNEIVAKKLAHVIESGLKPILCVGEVERDSHGEYFRYVERQLVESLALVDKSKVSKIVIAYEPVWAIGTGNSAVPNRDIHQMTIYIRKTLVEMYGNKIAMSVPIIYGGSVDPDNCVSILEEGEVSGLLIGRASLNPYTFGDLLKRLS